MHLLQTAQMNIIYYTHSRKMGPYVIPISIQSLYLRNFASTKSYKFSLPVTEYPLLFCYFSLIQRLISFNPFEPITVVCTTIYIFQEVGRYSSAYQQLSQYNLNIIGVLEGINGSIDTIIEVISENDLINSLAMQHYYSI